MRCSHASQAGRPTARQGFTLTEMLVTIAVIVLVAAIAFSGGKSALNSARSAEAMSNLRHTGALVANYAADNNNCIPPSADWGAIMYMGQAIFFQRSLNEFAGFAWNEAKPIGPLSDLFYDPVLKGKRQHPWGAFGVNQSIVFNTWDCRRYGHEKGRPLISIPDPSHKVIYCSAKEANWDSSWLINGDRFANIGWQPNEGPDARYGGMAGALFLDGHVEKLDVKNMDQAKRRRYFTIPEHGD